MTSRANAGDRIVLFTLVDLLIQVIFCGFLIFAANRASQGDVQDKIAQLARLFGVQPVSNFIDATSKLVAIADLDKVHVVDPSDKSKELFDDTTKMLERLDADDLRNLAAMDTRQRQAFMKLYATMAPADRQQLSKFVAQYGAGAMKALVSGGLSAQQLRTLLETLSRLSPADQDRFRYLAQTFASADLAKRQKIVAATAILVRPKCFGGRSAFKITEIPGGYLVAPLIPQIAPDVSRYLSSAERAGGAFRLGQSAFMAFGATVSSAHGQCMIEVDQATTTYDERQLISIQRWFGTH
jgi:hypothetical protein